MAGELVAERFRLLAPFLNERLRRVVAAAEAETIGYGGMSVVSRATGVSRRAIALGCQELRYPEMAQADRVRRPGAGRKRAVEKDPTLRRDLATLLEAATRGDPESPLLWTSKSVRKLADELNAKKPRTSHRMVAEMLHDLNYSLQANQKTLEGSHNPDRDAQFHHINRTIKAYQAKGNPVISVDTKKKELVGNFKNGGREWRSKGVPTRVRVHDFALPHLGKVSPYGVYDLTHNLGWVNVGVDHDTAAFAVESIRRWWSMMGAPRYPQARQLLITADAGGSNGYRVRLWKVELQRLANETGLVITVCHLPPGTSKWNKIEHRLFSFIGQNWRGKPLVSHEAIINLIGQTTTRTGLKVLARLDRKTYPKAIRVTNEQMAAVNLHPDPFHGEWNYTILPSQASLS